MARKLKSDKVLFITTLLLVCTSIVMVYSASVVIAQNRLGDSHYYVTRQTLWAVLGLAVMAAAMRLDYRRYRNDVLMAGLVGLVAFLLVAVLFSREVNGASRWLRIGGVGFQPSELAKLVCVLLTALILERRMHRINDVRYSLLPIGLVVAAFSVLILRQPDLGTALSLVLIVAVMAFAAGLSYRWLVIGGALAVPLLVLVLMSAEYRMSRISSYLNPWADPQGDGYQAVQSQVAVGTGGILGRGLNMSLQKLSWLPEPHNDFIYAVIGEELGLVGATGVLVCFCVIAWRGLRVSLRAEDSFGALVAVGITTMICAQALVNISVVLSLLPTKGIPLPLVSAGGSSLLVSLTGMGVLLNISQHEAAA